MFSVWFVLAFVASVSCFTTSHFDLKKSKKEGTTLGIFTNHIYGGFKVAWFKPFVSSNVTVVSCGDHVLWEAEKGEVLLELLSTAKCHDGHFAVVYSLDAERKFRVKFREYDTKGTLLHEHTLDSFLKGLHAFKAFDLVKPPLPADLPFHPLHLHLANFYKDHPELTTPTGDADL